MWTAGRQWHWRPGVSLGYDARRAELSAADIDRAASRLLVRASEYQRRNTSRVPNSQILSFRLQHISNDQTPKAYLELNLSISCTKDRRSRHGRREGPRPLRRQRLRASTLHCPRQHEVDQPQTRRTTPPSGARFPDSGEGRGSTAGRRFAAPALPEEARRITAPQAINKESVGPDPSGADAPLVTQRTLNHQPPLKKTRWPTYGSRLAAVSTTGFRERLARPVGQLMLPA